MEFFTYFVPVFKAVFVIFFIGFVSGFLLRKKVLQPSHIEGLTHITVVLLLPCLTFSKIVQYFNPNDFYYWWVLPLLAIVMIATGLGISSLFYIRKLKQKRAFIALSGFMNANYMVLPIAQLVFTDNLDEFLTYTFLFVLGVIPLLWSVGKFMVTSNHDSKLSFNALLSPPFVACVLALFFVLTKLNAFIPNLILVPIGLIGDAAIPAVTLILGATLGGIALKNIPPLVDIVKVLSTKLLILPAITILVLLQTHITLHYPLIADLLVIQASVAPATQLIIQVKKYGGDTQNVGSMMFIAYALCLITIPFWFMVWNMAK